MTKEIKIKENEESESRNDSLDNILSSQETDKPTSKPVNNKKKEKKKKETRAFSGKSEKGDKQSAIDNAISLVQKAFGRGAVMRMKDSPLEGIDAIPTGSLGLDYALGVGGYPRGRIVEIFGPEASGKTTLALQGIAEAQKAGGGVLFIDAEHALDIKYAKALGVDVDELVLSQPDYGEQGLEVLDMMIRSGGFSLAVVDSVAALVPRAELDGDMGDHHVGLHARLMSQAMRKLSGIAASTQTTIIFINQLRMKIGVMFGNPEVTTGGNALKFYSSVRLDVRSIGKLKDGDKVVGSSVRVTVVKNKVAPPFGKAEFDIAYGVGVSYCGELVDYGTALGVVEKSGSWYEFKGLRAQGRKNLIDELREHPEIAEELAASIQDLWDEEDS